MVIGLTGGIGSGKSFIAEVICSFENTVYYHADEQAKNIMNTSTDVKNKIISIFGDDSYQNNVINRKYLSSLVFKDANLLHKLTKIVHPIVKNHFKKFIQNQNDNTLVIYENAILFESGSDAFCDIIISVNAPKDLRIKRVIERDNISKKEIKKRIKNQWSDSKRNLLSNYIINNIEKSETLLNIKKIYNFLTKKLV